MIEEETNDSRGMGHNDGEACKKMIRDQKEAHKKRIRNPPQIPDSVLYKKRMKKEERDIEARRKDVLSHPPHFWESFYNHVEKKEDDEEEQ